jgi:hypothetical protein
MSLNAEQGCSLCRLICANGENAEVFGHLFKRGNWEKSGKFEFQLLHNSDSARHNEDATIAK